MTAIRCSAEVSSGKSPFEFFSKIFNEQLFDTIRPKIEKRMADALALLPGKQIYSMSKEG